MEELSGGGSRRPLGGADEREEKVVAEGVWQKRWLQKEVCREKGGCSRDCWEGKSEKEKKMRVFGLRGGRAKEGDSKKEDEGVLV